MGFSIAFDDAGPAFRQMTLLDIDRIKKSYPDGRGGARLAVDIPRFSMASGIQLAMRGPSGSGKTTFLNLISGILTPDYGEVRLEGKLLSSLSEPKRDRIRAARIGYVFQSFHLLQGFTLLENLCLAMRFGGRVDRGRAMDSLERVGLADRSDAYPSQLSVGQQQRVAVARAVVNKPALVLADEPTGSLDPANARAALELISGACDENGAALLLVSHDEGILKRFQHVADLSELNKAATGGTVEQ